MRTGAPDSKDCPRNRPAAFKFGLPADTEALATLSPYQTEHINRFGNYSLNPNRTPEPLKQHLQLALA